MREIGRELHRTRLVPITVTAPGNYFGASDYTAPITFRTRIRITGAAPTGALFQFGTAGQSIAAWVTDAGTVVVAAGDVSNASLPDDGATATRSFTVATGEELDLAFAAIPGAGVVAVWVNGRMTRSEAVNNTLQVSQWGVTGGVGVFGIALASSPTFVPSASRVAPTDFEIIEPLSIYQKQAPRELSATRQVAPVVVTYRLLTDGGDPILAEPGGEYILAELT